MKVRRSFTEISRQIVLAISMFYCHDDDSHFSGLKPDDRQSSHIENDSVDWVCVSDIIFRPPIPQFAVEETVVPPIRSSETKHERCNLNRCDECRVYHAGVAQWQSTTLPTWMSRVRIPSPALFYGLRKLPMRRLSGKVSCSASSTPELPVPADTSCH